MDPEKNDIHAPEEAHHDHLALELRLESSSDEEAYGEETRREPHNALSRVVTAQDWTGPDDPENPHNWPLFKRIWHTMQPAFFGFAVTVGSSIYSPAASEIVAQFHVSPTASLLPVSLYVLGLGFGPVLAAPISETYGRMVVYRASLPLSMLFTLGAGFSQSFASLLVCRFFAGLLGSPVLAVGAGTNADLFPPRTRANATIAFLLAPFLGTSVGPIIGGFAAQYKSWRWTQWCLLFMSIAVYTMSLPMKETYKKMILEQRAKRLGLEPPKKVLPSGFAAVKFLLKVTLVRPIHMLFFEPIVMFLSLYSAFTFGVLFATLPAFPIVFHGVYGFDLGHTGLSFLSLAIGYFLAVPTAVACDAWFYQRKHRLAAKQGKTVIAPEHRLYSAMMGGFGVTIGLFWFGWSARADVHWIVPMIGMVPFAWGNLSIFCATALYCVDVYGPLNGASAMAANSLARYVLGAAFPLFTVQMYERLHIDWASTLLALLSLLMLPIPWVLFKYGPRIRANSHYETMKA